jgi:hypothetical protein
VIQAAATSPLRTRKIDSAFLILILLTTVVLCFTLYWHLYLNGSRFHSFNWHRTPFWPLFPLTFVCAAPVFLVDLLPQRFIKPLLILPLLMVSCFALELTAATLQWNSLEIYPLVRHVKNPLATSFFNDAEDLARNAVPVSEFLRTYHDRLASFHYHSHNKGPILILFYYGMLKIFPNPNTAALIGALTIGALATTAIPAAWYMIRSLTSDSRAALYGAAFFTLTPGLHMFLPEFDQVYVPLTALLIALWSRALTCRRSIYAILAALTLSITCLFAFNTLVIGAFLLAVTLLHLFRRDIMLRALLIQYAFAIATVIGFYLFLYTLTGYNPIATLKQAWHQQNVNLKDLNWPWPATIPTDLTDFLITLGWLPLVVLISFFTALSDHRRHVLLVLFCLAQPTLVALTGLVQSETARLWLFMTPLIALPLGLELSRWSRAHRLALFFCQTLLLAFITQNLRFH